MKDHLRNIDDLCLQAHTSKGCVAKCTFCQRGSKGYITYNLDDLEKHLIELKEFNVGFLSVDDENFDLPKYTYEVAKHSTNMICFGMLQVLDAQVLQKRIYNFIKIMMFINKICREV